MRTSLAARAAAVGAAFLVSCGVGNAQTPSPAVFRSLTFAGIGRPDIPPTGFALESQGNSYQASSIPVNTFLNFTKTYTGGPEGDTTFTALSAANYRGFWSTGTHAEGNVTNAYTGWNDGPQGFYVLGGMGSWTRHRFVSPESLSGPYSVFDWHVSGASSTNFGTATSRLDFAVTTGVSSIDDLYNTAVTPNLLTRFGPGSYSYTTAVALDTPLDFLFWSSSFWQVTRPVFEGLPGPGNLFGLAEFMNSFEIDNIALFNGDGTPVSTWSLLDERTGQAVFTQNGRVTPTATIPEPGAGALFAAGLLPLTGVLTRRRKRNAMKRSLVHGWALLILALAAGTPARAVLVIDYPASTPTSSFTFNADAAVQGDGSLQLTSFLRQGVEQRGSFFFNNPVNVSAFTTTFRFRLTPQPDRPEDDPWADGITFTLQNQGANAIGGGGSFLGYAGEGDGIQPSVGLKFKTFALGDPNNGGDPSISTVGVLVNGQDPTGAGIGLTDLLRFGPDFNLGSGATFRADISYSSGANRFALTLTNEDTGRSVSLTFTINIPAFVGGNSAYAGFTGGTGLFVADQRILSWRYDASGTAPAPLRPTITSITPPSAPAGSAPFPMTIRGAGFVPGGSSVTFNNTPVAVNSASSTEIVLSVPASLLTTARVYNVIVAVGGRFSNAGRFEVTRAAAATPAPLLRIIPTDYVGAQRSGVDYFTGRHYVVLLFENQGSAPITGITFNSVRLQTGPSSIIDFESLEVEPGAQPPGSLGGMLPGQRLIVRFNFNIPPTGAGTVSVAGTSAQGSFNAGSRHVRFQ